MKTFIALFALFLSLSLTAQTNTATWYLNDTSGSGIQSPRSSASGNDAFASGFASAASGDVSTALGLLTTASGLYSTAMGSATIASGDVSTAMGRYTTAQDYLSFAIGSFNKTDETPNPNQFSYQNTVFVIGNGGYDSSGNFLGTNESRSNAFEVLFDGTTTIAGNVTAPAFIGDGSQLTNLPSSSPFFESIDGSIYALGASASGGSFAVGDVAYSSGYNSRALGVDTIAIGDGSTAIGTGGIASGNTSTAIGLLTTASGDVSTALGYRTIASDRSSLVVGRYNLLGSTVTNSATEFSLENAAFVIGNGSGWDSSAQQTNRSDALTVLFDGTTTIAGDLSINSDARLKANIISLGSTLAKLLQIDGKTYTMKKDESEKKKIGLLAQDIEKVFPELVSESNGIKSVNYQGLVPVLINALKEQDAIMKKQESKYLEQEKRLERLERLVAAMD